MKKVLFISIFILCCHSEENGNPPMEGQLPFTGVQLMPTDQQPEPIAHSESIKSKSEAKVCQQGFCFESPWSFARSFWAISENDVWAIGSLGTVLHFDGHTWKSFDIKTNLDLWLIWGSSQSDIWIVAEEGSLYHFDGTIWSAKDKLSFQQGNGLVAGGPEKIWGLASDDIWIDGRKAGFGKEVLYHFDGTMWKEGIKGWDLHAQDVFTFNKNVWVVSCENGTGTKITHYDGTKWEEQIFLKSNSKTEPCLQVISGSDSLQVWAVGNDVKTKKGLFYHYDGTWTDESSQFAGVTDMQPNYLKVLGKNNFWLIEKQFSPWISYLFHYQGTSLEKKITSPKDLEFGGFSGNDFWLSQEGNLLRYQKDSFQTWAQDITSTAETIKGMWGSKPSHLWLIATNDTGSSPTPQGKMMYYDGNGWQDKYHFPYAITSIFGLNPQDIWIGGENATLVHYNGNTTFQTYSLGEPKNHFGTVFSIWGISSNQVWAVGDKGMVLYFDGQVWKQIQLPIETEEAFNHVFGLTANDVWIVGKKGTLLHWDGKFLQSIQVDPILSSSIMLWQGWANTPNDVWFVGMQAEQSLFLHYDGQQFTKTQFSDPAGIVGIWGNAKNELWAASYEGDVFQFSQGSWKKVIANTFPRLYSLWGMGVDDLWLFGPDGVLLHKQK